MRSLVFVVVAGCGRIDFESTAQVVDSAPSDQVVLIDSRVCPPRYGSVPNAPHKYYVASPQGTFGDAETMCAADGAHVFVPNDRAEAVAVFNLIANTYVWLGIDDRVAEGDFRDHSGAVATFVHPSMADPEHVTWWWSPTTQPDNFSDSDCLSFIRSGIDPNAHLDDAPCSGMRNIVCECEF